MCTYSNTYTNMSQLRKKQAAAWWNTKEDDPEITFNNDDDDYEPKKQKVLGGKIKPVNNEVRLEALLDKPKFIQPKRFKIKKNNIKLIL